MTAEHQNLQSTIAGASAQLREAMESYLELLERGACPEPDEFIKRYPAIADELYRHLKGLDFIHVASPQLTQADRPLLISGDAEELGDFRLIREIGRGGMGVVYEAEQRSLDRRVAVKVLPFAALLDKRQLERFRNEARAAAMLKHPRIVSVHQTGCERGVHYYAMELVDGRSLAEIIQDVRSQSFVEIDRGSGVKVVDTAPLAKLSTDAVRNPTQFFRSAARLGVELGTALHYAHEQGVIHRDIKPSNILIDDLGEPWISDFGLAQIHGANDLTLTGDVLGTLRYMSPEQAEGQKFLDQRTDVYSLGLTLYELLTRTAPFENANRQSLLTDVIQRELPVPNRVDRAIPDDLSTIIMKSIAKEPEQRYASALELADDLARYLENRPIRARRVSQRQRLFRWARRNPVLAVMATCIAFLLVTLAAGGIWTAREQTQIAEEMKQRAKEMSQLAQREKQGRLDLQERTYVLAINAAYDAWSQGNVSRTRQLIEEQAANADLLGFGWRYLRSELDAIARTPTIKHDTSASSVVVSRDGEKLVTAGGRVVKVWNLRTEIPSLLCQREFPADISCAAWSSDGKTVAVGSLNDKVLLLRGDDLEIQDEFDHLQPVLCLDFSSDGSHLAAGGRASDGKADVSVWELHTKQEQRIDAHAANIESLDFSPDGTLLATASTDNFIKLWSLDSLERVHSFRQDSPMAVAFSDDGQSIAVGSFEYELGIYDVPSGDIKRFFRVPPHTITSLVFLRGEELLATASLDGTVKIWDLISGHSPISIRGQKSGITSLAYAPSNDCLYAAGVDGTVRINSIPARFTKGRKNSDFSHRSPIAISPDNRLLAVGKSLWTEHWEWDPSEKPTGIELIDIDGSSTPIDDGRFSAMVLEFMPTKPHDSSGRLLVIGGRDVETKKGLLRIVNVDDGTLIAERQFDKPVYSLAVAPDGEHLAVVCEWTSQIFLLDRKIQTQRQLESPSSLYYSVAFSPDGKTLVAGDARRNVHRFRTISGGPIQQWDLESGRHVRTLSRHTDIVLGLAFSPDGDTLASSSVDRTIQLWDMQTGQVRQTLAGHPGWVTGIAITPDGKTLVSAGTGGRIRLWRFASGEPLATIQTPESITFIEISFDGSTLAMQHMRETRIWHASRTDQRWPALIWEDE